MCVWCNKKDSGLEPMVSNVKVPMVCTECGTVICTYGWQELKSILQHYGERVQMLEEALIKKDYKKK